MSLQSQCQVFNCNCNQVIVFGQFEHNMVGSCNYWSYNVENRRLHVCMWLVSATSAQAEMVFSEAGEMLQEDRC